MIIRDKIKCFAFLLQLDGRSHHPESNCPGEARPKAVCPIKFAWPQNSLGGSDSERQILQHVRSSAFRRPRAGPSHCTDAHTARREDLATWLIRRASDTTTDQALSDLATYMAARDLECIYTMVFQGLTPEAACEFDRSITLLPWETFPDPAEKDRIERDLTGLSRYASAPSGAFSKPTGALVYRSQAQIAIVNKADLDWRSLEPPSQISDLFDALMCIGLTLPPGPPALGWWTKYPKWVPFYEPSERHESPGISSFRPFPGSSAQEAKILFNAFLYAHQRHPSSPPTRYGALGPDAAPEGY